MTARQSNLLGALAVALADRIRAGGDAAAGRGGRAAAALTVLAGAEATGAAPMGIEGLRRQLGLSQPATVRLVDALVADGALRRAPGPDARSIVVVLTAAGRRAAAEVATARRAVLDHALGVLSGAERASLGDLVERMLARLAQGPDDPAPICRRCDRVSCPPRRCPVGRY